MDLEETSITRTRKTGYPETERDKVYGLDVLGNNIYLNDDVIAMTEGIYHVDSLPKGALMELLDDGGIYQVAE